MVAAWIAYLADYAPGSIFSAVWDRKANRVLWAPTNGFVDPRTGTYRAGARLSSGEEPPPITAVPQLGGHRELRTRLKDIDPAAPADDVFGFTFRYEGNSIKILSWRSRSVNMELHGDIDAAAIHATAIARQLQEQSGLPVDMP